jgi:hypothetical protein
MEGANHLLARRQLQSSSKTKKSLNLCDKRGCRRTRATKSMFCGLHQMQYYYLDMANLVNIPMQGAPKDQIISDIRKNRKRILEAHFRMLVNDHMQATFSDENCGVCDCGRYVRHLESKFCPKHLKLEMMKDVRLRHKNGLIIIPTQIKEKLRSLSSFITPEFMDSVSCRATDCGMIVDKWPHIGFCSTHIHSIEAIETIEWRYEILQSDIAYPDLQRIILAYI